MKISKANKKTGIESFNIHNKICKKLDFVKSQGCYKDCYYNKIIRIYVQITYKNNYSNFSFKPVFFIFGMMELKYSY